MTCKHFRLNSENLWQWWLRFATC